VKQRDLIVQSLTRQGGRNGIVTKDAGDRIIVMDAQGNEIRSIPKGMTDAQRGAASDRDRGLDLRERGLNDKDAKAKEGRARLEKYARDHATRLVGFVDLALKLVNATNAGPISIAKRRIPGSDAYNLGQRLETIRANVGFKELTSMRAASPTGGALGQVTERELAFLQAVEGSLDQSQSPSELMSNLRRIRESAAKIMSDNGGGPAGAAPAASESPAPSRAAPRGRAGFSATEVK
jgi:hypothetical protein